MGLDDLTAAAGAPRILLGDVIGFVNETQHVVFRSPVGESSSCSSRTIGGAAGS